MQEVKRIKSDLAQSISIKNHYLHRKCPCTVAYGYFEDGVLKGVIIYGCPASHTLKDGICGKEEASHVLELKRLWIDDNSQKFAESYFIAKTIRLLRQDCPDKDILISYADTQYGHVGTVYQATKWIYTGHNSVIKDYVLIGDERDHLSQADELKRKFGSVAKAKEVLGVDKFELRARSLKHRYIMFNGKSRARNRELLSKLKYPILPYPKLEKKECQIPNNIVRKVTIEEWFN